MKFQPILFIAALCAATFFSSCQNDGDASKSTAVDGTGVQSAPPGAQPATPDASLETAPLPLADPTAAPTVAPAPPTTATPPTEPPQNAAGVWHYTCPKGCKGGGGAATACAKCGTTLTHNTAYHAQPNAPTTAPSGTTTAPSTTPQKTPEPAQNAAGVWHYTCPGGCPGGGGAAAPCGKCGKTLAHNSAYHQK